MTGLSEERALEILAEHCGIPLTWMEGELSVLQADMIKAMRAFAAEQQDFLRHKLWMIACHATGGGIPEIEGIDRPTNAICVQITASRNKVYQAGKDAAEQQAGGWRPIESALKDGTRVLLWTDSRAGDAELLAYVKGVCGGEHVAEAQVGWWDGSSWNTTDIGDPTHWQPLPTPPTEEARHD